MRKRKKALPALKKTMPAAEYRLGVSNVVEDSRTVRWPRKVAMTATTRDRRTWAATAHAITMTASNTRAGTGDSKIREKGT